MSSVVDPALFPGAEYEVPFPEVDEKSVSEFVLRVGGTIRLNRNDLEHAQLMESLTLGRHLTLEVAASVESKVQSARYDDAEDESAVYAIVLKVHSLVPYSGE